MKAPDQNRNIAMVLVGTAALSFFLSGNGLAQAPAAGSAPKSAGAQTKSSGAELSDKYKDVKINLSADQGNLLDTLRTLMKGAKADYVIDDELKAGTATLHFKDLPFKDALAAIVKVSSIPITFEIKDDVFHFMRRTEAPIIEKQEEPAGPVRPRFQVSRAPLGQISSNAALHKLTGPYNTPPPTLYYHTTEPGSHGSTSSSGLSGSGLLQSNGARYNPDGSVSRTGLPPINLFGLLRGLLGR